MRTHLLKLFPSLFGMLILAGCATVSSTQPAAENKSVGWEDRTTALSNIKNWDLHGLIAVHARNDAFSANWHWQQLANHDYTIEMFGPMGSNSLQITGTPSHVTLETSDGKKASASSPETLLQQQVGWQLPVSNLYYWIRGLPVPNVSAQKHFDAYHHLTTLVQQDWTVQYLRYTAVNHVDLPSKMVLTNPAINIKLIINH